MKSLARILVRLCTIAHRIWKMVVARSFHRLTRGYIGSDEATWIELDRGPASGIEFLVNPESFHELDGMIEGNYDRELYDFLDAKRSWEDQVIWDVGAHMGYHALAFAKRVGQGGRVVAFEPNPAVARRLRQNIEHNEHLKDIVSVIQKALADADDTRTLRMVPDPDDPRSTGGCLQESAHVPLGASAYRAFSDIEVRTVRADSLLDAGVVPAPKLIKIDVEGAEGAVLRGAKNLLDTCKPLLFIEIHSVKAMHNVAEQLYRHGYKLHLSDEVESTPSRGFLFAQ